MTQATTLANHESQILDVTVVTLEEIEARENAVTQIACCIWNIAA